MISLKGKYIIEEIDGVRCRIIETGISLERVSFLKEILEYNKYEVKSALETKKDENVLDTYKIGVTDIVFNPTLAIYKRKLKHKSGKSITPAFWEQKNTELLPFYWEANN